MENQSNIEELFINASETDSEELLNSLLKEIIECRKQDNPEIPKHIEFVLESWGETVATSGTRASFCVSLAEIGAPDTPLFRNSLGEAIKSMLPPYLAKAAFFRALGIRDNSVPINEIIHRFNNIL